MGSYSDVPTDELIQQWKDTAEERASILEDNRDEDDQHHYDRLGDQLDEISEELIGCGVKTGRPVLIINQELAWQASVEGLRCNYVERESAFTHHG